MPEEDGGQNHFLDLRAEPRLLGDGNLDGSPSGISGCII